MYGYTFVNNSDTLTPFCSLPQWMLWAWLADQLQRGHAFVQFLSRVQFYWAYYVSSVAKGISDYIVLINVKRERETCSFCESHGVGLFVSSSVCSSWESLSHYFLALERFTITPALKIGFITDTRQAQCVRKCEAVVVCILRGTPMLMCDRHVLLVRYVFGILRYTFCFLICEKCRLLTNIFVKCSRVGHFRS